MPKDLGDEIINFSSVTKIGKDRVYEIIENIIAKTSWKKIQFLL